MPAIKAIFGGFMIRFGQFFDLKNLTTLPALIATCTDPYFKLRWLPKDLASTENITWIQNLIINAADVEFQKFCFPSDNDDPNQGNF